MVIRKKGCWTDCGNSARFLFYVLYCWHKITFFYRLASSKERISQAELLDVFRDWISFHGIVIVRFYNLQFILCIIWMAGRCHSGNNLWVLFSPEQWNKFYKNVNAAYMNRYVPVWSDELIKYVVSASCIDWSIAQYVVFSWFHSLKPFAEIRFHQSILTM